MIPGDITGLIGPTATLLSSLGALITAIVAAVKSTRAASSAEKTERSVEQIRNTLMTLVQQRQHVSVNVMTGGSGKGGGVIDFSEEPPAQQ